MDYCVEGPKQKAGILPEPRLSIPPLRDHGVIQHQQKKNHQAVNPKCVITVPHLARLAMSSHSCSLLVALPAGVLPCLHMNRQQSRHRGA